MKMLLDQIFNLALENTTTELGKWHLPEQIRRTKDLESLSRL